MSLDGLLGSTTTTQCRSLFREYIPVEGFDSSTATIGSGFLNLFCRRVTDVTSNFSSMSSLYIHCSAIFTGRFMIIIVNCLFSES